MAALLMAVWRHSPKNPVIIHYDQDHSLAVMNRIDFVKKHKLVPSMSRRRNCYDNATVESFFSSLKKEKIHHHIFITRKIAKAEILNHIEFL